MTTTKSIKAPGSEKKVNAILEDYRLACASREASILGRKEVHSTGAPEPIAWPAPGVSPPVSERVPDTLLVVGRFVGLNRAGARQRADCPDDAGGSCVARRRVAWIHGMRLWGCRQCQHHQPIEGFVHFSSFTQ